MSKKIFLSWSGRRSRQIAEALRVFLPSIVPSCSPWISSSDIHGGKSWREEILDKVLESKLGILCITPDNLHSEWLLFEAGALAANCKNRLVCPFLVEVSMEDLPKPLEQFQSLIGNRENTWRLVQTVAEICDELLENGREKFEELWPTFLREIQTIQNINEPSVVSTQDRIPRIEAVKALKYGNVLKEWNGSGEGHVLCYNIEMQTFVNPVTFHTVWGNLSSLENIKKIIILVSKAKSENFFIAAERLDFLTDSNFDKFHIREFIGTDTEPQDELYLDRIAFAMYRHGPNPDRGILHPKAGIFSLTPPFSRLSTSPFTKGSLIWTYEYTLLVDTSYDVINTLDSIWHQQSVLANSTMPCKKLYSNLSKNFDQT